MPDEKSIPNVMITPRSIGQRLLFSINSTVLSLLQFWFVPDPLPLSTQAAVEGGSIK
jgi:hypothetical protein